MGDGRALAAVSFGVVLVLMAACLGRRCTVNATVMSACESVSLRPGHAFKLLLATQMPDF